MVTAHVFLVAQRVAWVLNLCVQTLLIGAIIQRKLARSYPFFLTYLVVDLGCSLALLHIPFGTLAYAASFRIYQSIDAVLQLGVAGEVFQRLCVHFRQFRGMGRFRVIMGAMLLTLTGLFFLAVLPGVPAPYPHLVVIWIERWETAVLTVTLAMSWWVLTRFLGLHPPMRSNALAHAGIVLAIFAIFTLSFALGLMGVGSQITLAAINIMTLIGGAGCFVAWMLYVRPDGEELPPQPPVSAEALAYSRFWRRKILEHVQQAGR